MQETGNLGSIPGSGRYPGEGTGNPLQYSYLENPIDRTAWRAMVCGVTKSWTWLKEFSTHALYITVSTKVVFFYVQYYAHVCQLFFKRSCASSLELLLSYMFPQIRTDRYLVCMLVNYCLHSYWVSESFSAQLLSSTAVNQSYLGNQKCFCYPWNR